MSEGGGVRRKVREEEEGHTDEKNKCESIKHQKEEEEEALQFMLKSLDGSDHHLVLYNSCC